MKMLKWGQFAVRSTAIAAALFAFSAGAAGNVPSFKDAPVIHGDHDFCVGQEDGAYEHPDCRVYYQCNRGIGAETRCPDGTVFDASKSGNGATGATFCVSPASASNVDCGVLALHK